ERLESQLAAKAGLLVAAEGDAGECGVWHVDPDRAGLDATRHAMATRRIARPHRGHQAIPDVVRNPDRILLVLERDHGDDRTEDLLLRHRHRVLDTREHGRRIERAAPVADRTTGNDLGALAAALLDESVHLVAMPRGDKRANLRVGIERVADLQLLGLAGEPRHEVVVDRPLHQYARARLAG